MLTSSRNALRQYILTFIFVGRGVRRVDKVSVFTLEIQLRVLPIVRGTVSGRYSDENIRGLFEGYIRSGSRNTLINQIYSICI